MSGDLDDRDAAIAQAAMDAAQVAYCRKLGVRSDAALYFAATQYDALMEALGAAIRHVLAAMKIEQARAEHEAAIDDLVVVAAVRTRERDEARRIAGALAVALSGEGPIAPVPPEDASLALSWARGTP